MLKKIRHIIIGALLCCNTSFLFAQIAMPDTVCVGTSRTYKVNDAARPSIYTWKVDGVTQTSTVYQLNVTWNIPGTYNITVQEHANNGCDGDLRSGDVVVLPFPIANAGPDKTICFGDNATLNGSGGSTYQWTPSQFLSNAAVANPIVSPPSAGTYTYILKVKNSIGCGSLNADTVKVTMLAPLKIFAGNDTTASIGQALQLKATDINGGITNYAWSPLSGLSSGGIQNPVLTLNATGTYTYTVNGSNAFGCNASDNVVIRVFKTADIYVPTIFTPNKDGTNDIFTPTYVGIKEVKYFSVYNRFGQLVFTTKNQAAGWNGLFNGKLQGNEAFVWQVEGISYDGRTIYKKGTVILAK